MQVKCSVCFDAQVGLLEYQQSSTTPVYVPFFKKKNGALTWAGAATKIERVFSSIQNLKKCYSTCHVECLRPVHGALNVDEKKTNYTVWWKITRRMF